MSTGQERCILAQEPDIDTLANRTHAAHAGNDIASLPRTRCRDPHASSLQRFNVQHCSPRALYRARPVPALRGTLLHLWMQRQNISHDPPGARCARVCVPLTLLTSSRPQLAHITRVFHHNLDHKPKPRAALGPSLRVVSTQRQRQHRGCHRLSALQLKHANTVRCCPMSSLSNMRSPRLFLHDGASPRRSHKTLSRLRARPPSLSLMPALLAFALSAPLTTSIIPTPGRPWYPSDSARCFIAQQALMDLRAPRSGESVYPRNFCAS